MSELVELRDSPELVDVPESWVTVETEDLHRDGWVVALRADRIRPPDGHPDADAAPFRRLVVEHPGAAIVLAVDEEERVVLLRQYRHPGQHRFVELPAGLLDQGGEDPLEVAQRELREEVGLEASQWTWLASSFSSPGLSAEVMHLYLARGLVEVGRGDFEVEHEEADMEVFRAPFADLHAAVVAGELSDAPLLTAVLLAQARGLVGAGGGPQ